MEFTHFPISLTEVNRVSFKSFLLYSILVALFGCVAGEVGEKKVAPAKTPLSLTSLSPTGGNPAGGTSVTITGTGFETGMNITFGTGSCAVTAVSETSVTCTTSAHAISTVNVVVTRADESRATLTSAYTFRNAPNLTTVIPSTGSNQGNNAISLTGTGFIPGASVTVGVLACSSVTYVSATNLTCTIPSCGGSCPYANATVATRVTNPDNQASGTQNYTFADTPIVTSVTPNAGALAGGGTVTIAGSNFKPVGVTDPTVLIGAAACTVSVANNTSITCSTGADTAGTKNVTVTNESSLSGTLVNGFTYRAAPTITSISPTAGNPSGGYSMTITGTNFDTTNGAVIQVGGTNCTTSSVTSATTATCTVPAGVAGATTVTLVNNDANSQAATPSPATADDFTYQNAPTVTAIYDKVICDGSGGFPACTSKISAGPLAGGRQVYIEGTGFVTGATATINSVACGTLIVNSATQITCTTAAQSAGTYAVQVTNADSQSGSLASAYTYRAAPTITSFTPNAGALAGATSLTINGTGFVAGASVVIDASGTPATCTPGTLSSTQITCTTTAHAAGAFNITVTNTDSQSVVSTGTYRYQVPPTFSSVTPDGGPTGGAQTITIAGTNFDTVNGMTITIGGANCTAVNVSSSTSATCSTPVNALGTYNIVLTNNDGNSQNVTAAGAYTYRVPPTLTDIYDKTKCDLSGGPPTCTNKVRAESINGLNQIYIIGTNFLSGATVTIGGSSCTSLSFNSSTQLTCTTPALSVGTKTVRVTNPDGQSFQILNLYKYQVAPTITSVSPNAGALAGSGTTTIYGTGFDTTHGVSATINGSACTSVTGLTSSQFSCTTPVGGALDTPYDVVVTLGDGDNQSATSVGAFTYKVAPTVSSINPTAGSNLGGTTVTITGTGFDTSNGANVTIGGSSCNFVNVTSATSLTCITGTRTPGTYDVVVTNRDANNQSATLSSAYSYQIKPTVISVTPTTGSTLGGTTLTVNGSGFISNVVTSVSIGGASCAVQAAPPVTASQLTCITSSNTQGLKDVVVTNANDGQSGTLTGGFTYYPPPTITAVTPSYGPVAGSGPTLTITGTNFIQLGLTKPIIRFDPTGTAVDCASVTLVNSNTLTCASSPAHAAGYVTVRVINPDGDSQFADLALGFSFWPQPTVATVVPGNGPASGGTTITITGTGFGGATGVSIGGTACTSVNVTSATTLTCVTGALTAGTYNVVVSTFDGQSGTLTNGYIYDPPPTISSVYHSTYTSVSAGQLAGTDPVTVNGTNFVSGASISIGGVACATSFVSSTQLTCVTGANTAGFKNVVVTNPDGQSVTLTNGFEYRNAPTISSVTLPAGALAGGTSITIAGTGFQSNATVSIDPSGTPAACAVTALSSTSITCTTSAHAAGTYNVRVTNEEGQSVTAASVYTYQAAPTVSTLSVNNGPSSGGTSVTITGTGILAGATASFGGTNCTSINVTPPTTLTCLTPSHATGLVNVVVTNADNQTGTLVSSFTFQGTPSITSVSPSGGNTAGSTLITISGDQFYAGATVTIDPTGTAASCTGVTVVNINTITCTTSAHTAGTFTVRVVNADSQTGNLVNGFTYRPPPIVSGINPIGGPLTGGTAVTITGNNFISGSTVAIGGVTCSSPNIVSSTSLTCTTGASGATTADVVVTLPDTQSGTLSSAFTYRNPPTVSSVDISSGSTTGGLSIAITGTGFITGATAYIGGTQCTTTTFLSATSLTCLTPAKSAGTYNITVTNTDLQTGTLTNGFTYSSTAQLQWQVGSVSPNPPDPDSYGTTAVNVTHTYTLRNVGDVTSGAVSISITGTNPTAFFKGTDTCNGNTLNPGSTCTVQITFLGGGLPTGSYSAILNATATPGTSDTNSMSGSVP